MVVHVYNPSPVGWVGREAGRFSEIIGPFSEIIRQLVHQLVLGSWSGRLAHHEYWARQESLSQKVRRRGAMEDT